MIQLLNLSLITQFCLILLLFYLARTYQFTSNYLFKVFVFVYVLILFYFCIISNIIYLYFKNYIW